MKTASLRDHRPDDEDRVPERVRHAERPRVPLLVPGRPFDLYLRRPLLVVLVRAIHEQRDARLPAMSAHRAVDRDPHLAAPDAEEAVLPVLGHLETCGEAERVDVEGLR